MSDFRLDKTVYVGGLLVYKSDQSEQLFKVENWSLHLTPPTSSIVSALILTSASLPDHKF